MTTNDELYHEPNKPSFRQRERIRRIVSFQRRISQTTIRPSRCCPHLEVVTVRTVLVSATY